MWLINWWHESYGQIQNFSSIDNTSKIMPATPKKLGDMGCEILYYSVGTVAGARVIQLN